jgi:peroxiredoxin
VHRPQIFPQEKAVAWKNDTKCEFPVLVDADRHLYVALGLKRSVSKVWRISSLVYYAEQKLAGRKLLAMLDEDDPLQLGGDFIINSTGKLVFIYQSKTSTDRPSVDSLLNFLRSNSDLA